MINYRSCFIVLSFAVFVFTSGIALAADTAEKLHQVESQLGAQKQQEASLDEKAKATSENLKELRQKMISATQALQAKTGEAEQLQDKLDDLENDIDSKKAALAGQRKKLSGLMEAFVELSRQPPESLLLHTQLTDDYIHRAILLRSIMPRLRDEAQTIAQDLGDFTDERAQMTVQKRLVQQAQENMQSQRRNLDQLVAARQGLLDRTEAQKEAIAKQLVSLTSEAQDLRQLLEKVTPKRTQASLVPHALRGALKMPVAGSVIRGFGAQDSDGVTSQGLTLTAPSGSPVVAPASGRVVFAGPFKGYGKIMILAHDGGYHSFLAGFGRIDAEMGEDVEAGEPLGVLPVKSGARPELYFEWRNNTEPVDPGVR